MYHHTHRRSVLGALLSASALLATGSPALAQNYPSKPIRIIVGFAAGGGADAQARLVADALQKKYGQSVVVENRPGAGGRVALEAVARAEPDGYTIGAITGADALLAAIDSKLTYQFPGDFQMLSMVADYPFAIVTAVDGPYKSIGELLAAAKTSGVVTAASAGIGTTHHLAAELVNALAKTDIQSVPYKGSSSAMADVVGGRVTIQFAASPTVLKSGRLRALAITSAKRIKTWPDVPTLSESVPGYDVSSWMGLVLQAKAPKAIAEKLAADVRLFGESKEVQDGLLKLGLLSYATTSHEMKNRVDADIDKWKQLVRSRNINVTE